MAAEDYFDRSEQDFPSHPPCRSAILPIKDFQHFCCKCGGASTDSDSFRVTSSLGFFVYTHHACASKGRKKGNAMSRNPLFGALELERLRMRSAALLHDGRECWIIWNPDSDKPPTIAYGTADEAWKNAEELAAKFVGERFYVMHSLGHAVTSQPVLRVEPVKAMSPAELRHATRKIPNPDEAVPQVQRHSLRHF
jgi:hypothetical protein